MILTSFVNFRNKEQRIIQSSIQDTMGKKGKAPSSEDQEMMPLYTDTTCNRDAGITTWESMYSLLEEENPKIMEVTTTAGSHGSYEASITELACSFLHRIAARPKVLPYMDMVKWVLDSADITNRQFKTQCQQLTESLFSQNLSFISANKKCARGQKNCTREARIKKQRQFLMHD